MPRSTTNQLVDRIERRGLVRRGSPETDRRVILLRVTPQGKQVAESLYADVSRRLPDVADALRPQDQQALRALAVQITDRHMPGPGSGDGSLSVVC
ncbi:hypothetical protein KIH74_32175 [Kineosporia sp. J2-2]|uniref:HTH marR-type domain-containing protein n=1 Tax=Kineosporia corallincola TaxID=2835133 RepID=A0ABS5TS87_9ACTN|nr:hypothetical protein [Kineosporia corallincola]MBT0773646.1 hypothetical protein [Kineosporia corallincola]